MKFNILQKLIFFSIMVLACNVVIGYAGYKGSQKLRDSGLAVEHTEKVIKQTGNILSLGIDIETAARGFVITRDSAFLEPLYSAKKTTFAYIEQLKLLTVENKTQQMRVDSLNFYMHKHVDFSFHSVELINNEESKEAIALTSTKLGKKYTDHIRHLTKDIQQEETTILKDRKLLNENRVKYFNWFSMIMFILMSAFTILFLIATGKNLHQKKEKEKREQELVVAKKEMNYQRDEKEKEKVANKELEAFSYSVAHDMRAPLRHINGYVNLLIKNNSSQLDIKGLRYLNTISESSIEMGVLIDALLTFSRLSRIELSKTIINSGSMIARIIKTFTNEIEGRNVEIKISELPDTTGDENLIYLVWTNLISNALKYSRNKEKTVIDIGAETGINETIFHIRDNGVGFDMKYSAKLFHVFNRLHHTAEFEGIGIGLANVDRIITRHGGKCWAESEIGKGSTFFFSKPNDLKKVVI